MKILLVGEASIAARMADKLRAHVKDADVTTTTAQHFHTVPQGTEWVLIMDGGQNASRLLSVAAQAKAKAVSIPTGWTHAEAKLARAGFFSKRTEVPLTQRPFAHIADALAAQKQREREEAERKAAAAVERGLNPPPLTEDEEEALTRPDPTPPPPVEPFVPPDVRDEVPPALPSPPTSVSEAVTKTSRRMITNTSEKEARLRQLFDWNPDLALSDAQAMLAAVASDGRALNWTTMSEIRRAVRSEKGLPVDVRRYSQIEKRLAPANPDFTLREDAGNGDVGVMPATPTSLTASPTAAGTTPTAPALTASVPTGIPYALPLPPGVESASRLLTEELEKAPEVETFTLTFRRGERPQVRWRPNVEGSVTL